MRKPIQDPAPTYLPPFSRLGTCVRKDETAGTVTMPTDLFKLLLRLAAGNGVLDTAWYAGAYRDVAEAIRENSVPDALTHFCESGYFEGRRPRVFTVNEAWYSRRYPDVAAAVLAGKTASAHTHFNSTGYFEGRVPGPEAVDTVEAWNRTIERHLPPEQDSDAA